MSEMRHQRRQIFYGEIIIEQGQYGWRYIPIDADVIQKRKHHIFGAIRVAQPIDPQSPKNLDIRFYVLDETNFVDWLNRRAGRQVGASFIEPAQPTLATGRVKARRWNFYPPESGRYYLVLDNRYSTMTPKTVSFEAVEEWDEMIPEGAMVNLATTSPPLDRSLQQEIIRLIQESKVELIIVTPYIDMEVMNEIQRKADQGIKLSVITRDRNQISGEENKAAFDHLRRAPEIKHLTNRHIHARFIIGDCEKVLVSSADLSHDSLIGQYNAGVTCLDPSLVKKMMDYFHSIKSSPDTSGHKG